MAHKALKYAEDGLGVHSVYESAVTSHKEYGEVLDQLSTIRSRKRTLEEELGEREVDILIEETSKHPSMSATAMKDHSKKAIQKDAQSKALRHELIEVSNEIDRLESRKAILEQEVRIQVARLNELGGYLQYLYIVKQDTKPT